MKRIHDQNIWTSDFQLKHTETKAVLGSNSFKSVMKGNDKASWNCFIVDKKRDIQHSKNYLCLHFNESVNKEKHFDESVTIIYTVLFLWTRSSLYMQIILKFYLHHPMYINILQGN